MNRVNRKFPDWIARNGVRAPLAALGIVLVLMAGGRWLPAMHGAAADRGNSAGPAPIAVEVASAVRADVPVTVDGLGTVQAYNTVTVTSRVDGELQKLGFTEGQQVHKGDLLAQIDPRPYRAALELAEANRARDAATLASSQQDLERYQLLAPQNLTSQQTLNSQQARVNGLRAQLKGDQASIDNARTNLGYTSIRAPIDGRTGIRKLDVGNNVHAADTAGIVIVTQVQPITLIFTLPEESLESINTAMTAAPLTVYAMSRDGATQLDKGTVQAVDNQIDQATGTIRLKAVFANQGNALWPGQFINARVLVRLDRGALTVPTAALQRGPNGMFTYVIRTDSTVEARPLTVGAESGAISVVMNGLQEGERVATSNQYRLQPGARVSVVAAATTISEVARSAP